MQTQLCSSFCPECRLVFLLSVTNLFCPRCEGPTQEMNLERPNPTKSARSPKRARIVQDGNRGALPYDQYPRAI